MTEIMEIFEEFKFIISVCMGVLTFIVAAIIAKPKKISAQSQSILATAQAFDFGVDAQSQIIKDLREQVENLGESMVTMKSEIARLSKENKSLGQIVRDLKEERFQYKRSLDQYESDLLSHRKIIADLHTSNQRLLAQAESCNTCDHKIYMVSVDMPDTKSG